MACKIRLLGERGTWHDVSHPLENLIHMYIVQMQRLVITSVDLGTSLQVVRTISVIPDTHGHPPLAKTESCITLLSWMMQIPFRVVFLQHPQRHWRIVFTLVLVHVWVPHFGFVHGRHTRCLCVIRVNVRGLDDGLDTTIHGTLSKPKCTASLGVIFEEVEPNEFFVWYHPGIQKRKST